MTKLYLHIVFLLGFFCVQTELLAQETSHSFDNEWRDMESQIEKGALEEVKASFNAFAKKAIHHNSDSLFTEKILIIGDYFEKEGEFAERIHWYQYAVDSLCLNTSMKCVEIRRKFAEIFTFIEQYDKAILLLEDNLDFLNSKGYKDAISLENSLIARNYYKNNDFSQSEAYYIRSLQVAEEAQNLFYIILSYNNLGFFYSQTEEFEKAEMYYLKGIHILESKDSIHIHQEAQLALLKGNLGGIYLKSKEKFGQGIVYLNEDIQFNINDGEVELAVNATVELAKHYYEEKKYSKANETLNLCVNHPRVKEQNHASTELLVPVYYWLFKTHLEEQRSQDALHYFKAYDSLKTVRDEVRDNRRSAIERSLLENILNVQLDYQIQQVQLKEKANEILIEKNKHFFYRVLITMLSLLMLILILFLYGKKRISLMRVKKELAENKFEVEKLAKEKAKLELKYKNKDLTDFAIDISRKQEVLTEVKSNLTEILESKWDDSTVKTDIKNLIHYTNTTLLVDEQLKEFQENIEEVNYKFFDTLQKEYPDLTELDKNVCGLIRLGLSNKEIATMRNVSYKAVRMSRYRIRKKLNLEAETDMVEFLKGIG